MKFQRMVKVKKNITLTDYKISSKGRGSESIGQVDVSILFEGNTYHGRFTGNDIVEASCRSFLQAINNGHRAEKVSMKKIENEMNNKECYI